MKPATALTVSLLVTLLAPSVNAQWVEHGAPVSATNLSQYDVAVAPDGEGGAIMSWTDYRTGSGNIYAQRIDADGYTLWTLNGAPVCTAPNSQLASLIVSDDAGGAIIAWRDYRGGNYDIYVQRIDADGNALWTADGVAVCTEATSQSDIHIAREGSGGLLLTWEDVRNGNYDIFAQRVLSNGTVYWTADGIACCTDAASQYDPVIAPTGAGGAFIVWSDFRNGNYDIYGQRLASNGSKEWGTNGSALCIQTGAQDSPDIVETTLGTVIIAFRDDRSITYDIYATHIDEFGDTLWGFPGIAICTESNHQYEPVIASDGANGAVIAWRDYRSGLDYNYDIYAQRINVWGTVLWTTNGVPVCTAEGGQFDTKIIGDGFGGAIIVWEDNRKGDDDVYAQRLDADGNPLWEANGVAVCNLAGNQMNPALTSDGAGGAIIAWADERVSIGDDVYAQRIERYGYWGYPAPAIYAVRDVPGDQGGSVNLSWYASHLDPWPDQLITYYSIWRAISPAAAALFADRGALFIEHVSEVLPDANEPVVRRELIGTSEFFWELIDTHNAYYYETYSKVIPTLFDSTDVSTEYHYFQIAAHMRDPLVVYTSHPDSGYSVDNLAPAAPLGLVGFQSIIPEGLTLSWDPNREIDLSHYRVYRGLAEDFVPTPGNLIASPVDTTSFDGGWTWDSGYFYKVSALDIHGNESPYALLRPIDITGEEPPEVPLANYLAQNFPNPFNPQTAIRFGLKEPAHVSLRIYDAGGRLVRILVNEHREADRYEVIWDGRDNKGNAVASGVYLYQLGAGAFNETKKMVMLR